MKLSDPDVQKFIFDHEHDDETKIILRSKDILGIPAALIADQIKARRKARTKLPLFYKTPGIIYPPSTNLEQSSSEATAIFKRDVIRALISERNRFCDLTGGFGVDSFFISSVFTFGDVVEPNEKLIEVAKHNHALLGAHNLNYHQSTAEEFLKGTDLKFDLVYVDPSRRDGLKNKVIKLSDSEPDAIELVREFLHPPKVLLRDTGYLVIKVSPLLDLQQGIGELQKVRHVYVVAVDNEVKEVLFFCSGESSADPEITCVNLNSSQPEFRFTFSSERETTTSFSDPLTFLYEPNASIMKGGAFKSIAARFNLQKIDTNTHLYTSEKIIDGFPGRIFRVVDHVKPDKALREKFVRSQANILLRNYPMSVAELKKKTGLTEGGEQYLIGCSGRSQKFLMSAEKITERATASR